MITTGQELYSFLTLLNGGATVDATLADTLVDNARAVIEEERPWMALRATDSSITVTTANTWQTAKSLAGITNFSRFYGELPIRLFDGVNRIEYYRQVPFDRRLEYKDVGNTFVYDAANDTVYLNGLIPFNGTLYINHVKTSDAISLSSATAIWTAFPSRFMPVLGYYAIGIYKGAVDYDSINRAMLPENANTLQALKLAMEKWDESLAISEIENNDPTNLYTYPRSGAIDIYNN